VQSGRSLLKVEEMSLGKEGASLNGVGKVNRQLNALVVDRKQTALRPKTVMVGKQ
jgi:hypothetical protein